MIINHMARTKYENLAALACAGQQKGEIYVSGCSCHKV